MRKYGLLQLGIALLAAFWSESGLWAQTKAKAHEKHPDKLSKTLTLDDKSVQWNAILIPADGSLQHTKPQLQVIVDLQAVSTLIVVSSMTVTVDIQRGGKKLGTETFSFPLEHSGPVFGGKKVTHSFELTNKKYEGAGPLEVKPLHFEGTSDTHILVDQPKPYDPSKGVA